MARSIYFHSLGCRLNQAEVEGIARRFAAAGWTVVRDPVQADLCVVNTCAVTAQAERKTRHLLNALHRANPTARIAAIGCLATLEPQRLSAVDGVAWVVPNGEKDRVGEIVTGQEVPAPSFATAPLLRTRAFVKVQDGCDNRCTYCVVWRLRGPARSRPLEEVVAEVQTLTQAGCQEAVLTGVNLGGYGRDLGLEGGLRRLVETILARTDLPRLRLSSLEPWDVSAPFFDLWAEPRLCRQIHLPLQSGCDATLRRMGRRITVERYARLVEAARAAIPGLALTTDVIVGFPGEDEAAHEESLAFIRRMGFARLHVFPFSPRPGTPAARMTGQVPLPVRRERARQMGVLGARLAQSFQQRFVGQEMMVLWERRQSGGLWRGLTDNYIRVVTRSTGDLSNSLVPTRLVSARESVLVGEVAW